MALRSKDKTLFGGKRYPGEEAADPNAPSEREQADHCDQLEKDINELRSQYELYFMGIERVEPAPQRDKVKAELRRMVGPHIRNTAIRFRVQQLKARMISLENYWERTLRQRESGNYRRDQARVTRREQERKKHELAVARRRAEHHAAEGLQATEDGRQAPSGEGHPISGTALQEGRSAAETAGAPRSRVPTASSRGRPSARSAEDLTEPKLRRLYQTYIGARKRCGEKVDLRYEDMAAALRKQVPKLINQTGAKSVEFKVVIRSGKAVLKALPKHKE